MTAKLALIAFTLVALFVSIAANPYIKQKGNNDWWKHSLFYQIYPRSFKDSDGDGVGDIQGIISKMDHLKDAGITATWLSPIYKSPQVDAGYDISDYKDIHEEYGTMEDFNQLIKKANELGIKIIMDFVPNHSSDKHEWFSKSENREEGYENFYVWADGKNNDNQTPPNNWLSIWKYSAWEYSSIRKQWYLHQFAPAQPDLNYRDPKLVAEMKDVFGFWMDKGVHGFRIDAVPYLFENINLEDEPLSGMPNVTEEEYNYLDHIHTMDLEETLDMIYQFREYIDDYNFKHPDEDERIMMTEAYTNITNTMLYYGNGERQGAHFTFNFQLIPITIDTKASEIESMIKEWMFYMPSQYTPNWVIGNHDNHRVATKVGAKNVDGFNMLVAVLPGVAVTYNGEEIGMENGYVSWEDGQDPSACNGLPEKFNSTSRDFERTPFHWDKTKNAGFSNGDSTWLPVSEKYLETNLAEQLQDDSSHYNIYKKNIAIRKEWKVLEVGEMDVTTISDDVIVVQRFKENYPSVLLIFNLGQNNKNINLLSTFPDLKALTPLISNTQREDINIEELLLVPHESIIAAETT